MDAKFINTKNMWRGRQKDGVRYHPEAIVLHITEGSSDSAIGWFQNLESERSAHYVVRESGDVVQMVAEEDSAWAVGFVYKPTWKGIKPGVNPNLYTINIEVALLNGRTMPAWNQWKAVATLVKEISLRWSIPLDASGLVHHNEIHSLKVCPGWWVTRFYVSLFIRLNLA